MYKINLLPAELRPGFEIDLRRLLIKGMIIFLLAGLAGAYCGFIYRFFSLENELADAGAKLAELRPRVKEVQALIEERKRIEARVEALQNLINGHKTWSHVLADLNDILPVDTWLTGINIYYDPKAGTKEESGKGEKDTINKETGKPGKVDASAQDAAHVPNAVTIEGKSRSVPSVGIFLKNLNGLTYFDAVFLNDMHENYNEGTVTFSITAYIRESDR